VQSISRNPTNPAAVIAAAGVFSAALQCVYFREYLSVFSGNEFVIGMILAVWLCATGLGSLWAGRSRGALNVPLWVPLLIFLATTGLYAVRAGRLLFSPGEIIGPLPVLLLCLAGEAPFAFASGAVFGGLSTNRESIKNPYGAESLGALAGALITYVCVLLYAKNSIITSLSALPVIFLVSKKPKALIPAAAILGLLALADTASMHWKYNFPFSKIVYGREGEIAEIKNGNDISYMLNGMLYKSTLEKPFLEQAVHVPLGARRTPKNVLVIFDKGHLGELAKYKGVAVDCLESEPRLASAGCAIASPETFRPPRNYDAVFLGSAVPQTAATSRFYTVSFFATIKKIMADSGVITFTLPLSENYLSPAEKRLCDALKATMGAVFKNVFVFPGNGYTFMASDGPLAVGKQPLVETDYLESTILPFVTKERIGEANIKPMQAIPNTANRPISLVMGLNLWIDLFRGTWPVAAGLFAACLLAAAILLPKSRDALSIGSTGFSVGIYSVALLLLYQTTYGLLYSRVSLLLCSLTVGFAAGSLIKRLPVADLLMGLYCVITLGVLSLAPYPPAILFYAAHAGIGVLAAAQFRSLKTTSPGALYAADCVGGAMGMALTVAVIPVFGVLAVAAGLCAIKCAVGFYASKAETA
jgi:hypothetical protein